VKKVQKDVFVTNNGSEFINENEAARHERRDPALNEIEEFLFGLPAMRGVRACFGDDAVNEVLTVLWGCMVERPASVELIKILRQLEEGAPAAGTGPKKRR